MAKCKHEHAIALHTTDILNEPYIGIALEHGNLDFIQQIEEPSKVRIVTVETNWCPNCTRIFGVITAAA